MKKLNRVLQNAGLPLLIAVTVVLLTAACDTFSDSFGSAVTTEDMQVTPVALNQLKITWPAPADDEEAAMVDYYKVELLMKNSVVIEKRVEKWGTETVLSVSSGVYTARVTVVRTEGESPEPWSSTRAVSITTKATAPGAVTVQAAASPVSSGDEKAEIVLSWTAPKETGLNAGKGDAATMEAYTVYWQAGAAVSELNYMGKQELGGEASGSTIGGLEQGRDYSIIVVARNSASLESTSSVLPVSTARSLNPAAVAEFEATAAEDAIRITLTWQQATDFGRTTDAAAAEFDSYAIYWIEGNWPEGYWAEDSTVDTMGDTTGDTTGAAITITDVATTTKTLTLAADGLQPETKYSFMMVVENTEGERSAERSATATTPNLSVAPAVVTGFSATAAIDAIRIDLVWDEATDFGKTAVGEDAGFGSYTIYWVEGYWAEGSTVEDAGTAISIATATNTTRTLTEADGLAAASQYSFIIVVENAEGQRSAEAGTEASTPNLSEPPAAPQIDTGSITSSSTNKDATIRLSWTTGESGKKKNGKAATIEAYLIYWKEGRSVSETDAAAGAPVEITDATERSVELGELKTGTEYSLMVVAVNDGERRSSSLIAQKTTEAASTTVIAPQAITGVAGSTIAASLDIALNWDEATTFGSENDSAASFKEYRIYWKKGTEVAASGPFQAQVTPSTTTSYTITGLEAATAYSIAVVMVNSNDHVGPVETTSKTTILTNDLSTKPGAASNIRKDSSHRVINELKVLWDAAATKGRDRAGAEVETVYELYYASSTQYTDAASLIAGEAAADRIEAGGTQALVLEDLEAATDYDVVVVAVNSAVEERQEASDIATFTSNGIRSVSIKDGGLTVSGTTVTKFITVDSFDLSVEVEGENVDGLVSWESSNEEIVKVTGTGNTVSIAVVKIGTASITVTPAEDRAKTATVSIAVEKEDIGLGNYYFEYGEVSTVLGTGETFTITRNTIPDAKLIYSITQNPGAGEITVQNAKTGLIYVSGNLEKGSYTIEVSAEASGENPHYKGTVRTSVSIAVEEERLGYKVEMSSAAQGVFAIGDPENSYLFQVRGLADTAGVAATIVMKDAGGNELARTPERAVVYEEATGTSIVGVGFSEADNVDFSTLSGQLSIEVVVRKGGELYAEKMVEVATADARALYSWRDLQAMKNDLAGNYTLQNDIAFPAPGTYGFPRSGFVPIDNFSGTLNGSGKIISDLYINAPSLNNVGLFSKIEAANGGTEVVRDLTLQDPNITGAFNVGALIGELDSGSVKNIGINNAKTTDGVAVSGNLNVGGLVGYNKGSIAGHASGGIKGTGDYIGGLVGYNGGSGIVDGYATGAVSGNNYAGGLVGYTESSGAVTGYATGAVSGNNYVGGLVGYTGSSSAVTGYATGAVSGSNYVGGLVGISYGRATGYALGAVSGSNYAGGLMGKNSGETATGYVRGTVERSEGASTAYGLLLGSGPGKGYYSRTESFFVGIGRNEAAGVSGNSLSMRVVTTKESFAMLDFESAPWRWVADGRWPAIDIGDIKPINEQPTELNYSEEKLVYKAEMSSAAREVFAIGDPENSYLFEVRGLADAAGVVATIAMKDAGGNELAQTPERPVVHEEARGTNIVGAGFSEADNVDFSALSGQLSIEVVVKKGGKIYAEKTVVVATAGAGAIYSWRDLQAMKDNLAGNYTMQSDIAFPAPETYGFPGTGFVPIGDGVSVFSGTLKGNGKIISDLYINTSSLSKVGLFGYIKAGDEETEVVKDLTLQDPNITAGSYTSYTGALIGDLIKGAVKNVGVSSTKARDGAVVSGSGYTGGLVGYNLGGSIAGYTSGRIKGTGDYIGGLVGKNYGSVMGYATGAVSGTDYVGGLVGYSDRGPVTGYATGVVSGGSYVGGLVGYNGRAVTGYATGAVSGSDYVGGLVGRSYDGTVVGYVRGTVERSEGTRTRYGLLIGSGSGKGYYSRAESSFVGIGRNEATGFSGNSLSMRGETTKEAFALFDFENRLWRWVADGKWPAIDTEDIKLINEQPTESDDDDTCATAEDNRPEYSAGFFQIASWQELQWIENCLYESYRLTGNIAIPEPGQGAVLQEGFRPIGSDANPFTGTFDGGGYSITGLSIARSGSDYVGLFGYVYNGRIENLHIEHGGIAGRGYVGAVAGYAKYAEIEGVSMESGSTEEVSGGSYVGGLVGYNADGSVTGYVTGAVSGGNYAGGLAGGNAGTVTGYATGAVSGNNDVGGLVGYNADGTVTGYATGVVSGNNDVGGLVGYNADGTVTGYAMGAVSGTGGRVGGLVGYSVGTIIGYARGTVERSGGTNTQYGLLIGSGSGEGYYSPTESSFVGIGRDEATGFSGNPLLISREMTKETFAMFDFENGLWRWTADERWPSIDIGNIKPINEQPTEHTCVTAKDNRPEYSAGFYQIASWQELQWVENCLYESYRLTGNIAIPGPGQDGVLQEGFRPIGSDANPFTGTFDGGGYSITGLSIARSGSNYVGLFGYVYNGRIENLHIEHGGIAGRKYVGAVAGYAESAEIEGVSMESESTEEVSGSSYVGGLVGHNDTDGTVTGYASGAVSGSNDVGGLVGENAGAVTGHATGAVSGSHNVGGLVGWNDGPINGYATGVVSGSHNVGGLVGWNDDTINGYATGVVSGSHNVGGLVGWNDDTINGYATGSVSGRGAVGGLVGINWGSSSAVIGYSRKTVERRESTNITYGLLIGEGLGKGYYSRTESSFVGIERDATTGISGNPLSMRAETTKETFALFDFEDGPWRWVADRRWPAIDIGDIKLINEQPTESDGEDTCETAEDNRPEYSAGFFQIDSWQELQWMENCLYESYRLTDNIAIPEPGQSGVSHEGFRPIGSDVNPFTGNFDGGGYSITGLSIARSGSDYVGLFGYIHEGRIENLRIEHSGIAGRDYVGAVAGYARSAEIEGVSMESESIEKVSGGRYTGGLVGWNEDGPVAGYAMGAVSGGRYVGSLVGYNADGPVTGYATGAVSGDDYVGGLVGDNEGTVTGYATGVFSGDDYVGGLVGDNEGTVTGYATGVFSGDDYVGGLVGVNNDTVTGYATGAVSGNSYVGGLVGRSYGTAVVGYARGTVERSASNNTTYGLLIGAGSGKGYYSPTESFFVGIERDEATGFSGDPLLISRETTKEAFALFDFENGLWHWAADGKLPAIDIGDIKPMNEQPIEHTCVTAEDNRPEYSAGFFQIDNWQELQWMENCLYESYKLTGNIAIPALGQSGVLQEGFRPIGGDVNPFTGNFDGGGYSITGLNIARSGSDYVGLFGYIYEGRIENLRIEHKGIAGRDYVGAVAGYARSAEIEGVSMESEGTEEVSGDDYVGGLVGSSRDGPVTGYAMGAVSGDDYVGGLVGDNKGTVTGYATGVVLGNSYVGGLVGRNEDTVTGYATGVVLGNSYVGGLVGRSYGTAVVGYARGTVARSEGTNTTYGLLIGAGSGKGYNSRAESFFGGIGRDEATGFSGNPLSMRAETTKETFALFDFENGLWRWVAGRRWPAIDIGDIKLINEQPTEPDDEDTCETVEDNRPEYSAGFFQIDSWQELQWMENCLYESYKLTGNIAIPAPGQSGVSHEGFRPIGSGVNPFTGTFDGGGYSITGLSIARSESSYVGLFGYIYEGRIENLHIEHNGIAGRNYVGAVAGYARSAEIEGVSMESEGTEEVSGDDYVGGLVGLNSGTVTGYATGAVSGDDYVGGLVGWNVDDTVTGYATGAVSGNGRFAGGLVGSSRDGTVDGYATGVVSGDDYVGGLVGYSRNGPVTGYATGSVSGDDYVGGLVGNSTSVVTGYARGTVARSEGTNTTYGLLIGAGSGKGYNSRTESSFVRIGRDEATGFSGNPLSMRAETTKETFALFDFENGLWRWVAGRRWPAIDIGDIKLINEQPTEPDDEDTCETVEDNRPEYSAGFFQIDSWQELQWMENCLYESYKLTGNIAIPAPGQSGVSHEGFRPIGSDVNPFTGTFDGGGYSITGLSIARSGSSYVGLFGYIYEGRIENLHIEHNGIAGRNYVGAVAGYARSAEIEGVSMESEGTEKVSGDRYVGGLVGWNVDGTVMGYATGAVSGNGRFAGGLVGNSGGSVTGYATGAVSGNDDVGGLVGSSRDGTVTGYATGAVSGNDNVGGLVGNSTSVVTGYARGTVARSEGTNTTYGLLIGAGSGKGYYSRAESSFVGIGRNEATGFSGNPLSMRAETTKESFPQFDFEDGPWRWVTDRRWPAIDIGDTKPINEQPTEPDDEDTCETVEDNRPEYSAGFFQIDSWQELQWMENCLYESYKLTGNIDIPAPGQSGVSHEGFRPIGSRVNPFTGTFDGGGYSITGLSIARSGSDYVGLFGYIYEGRIEDLRIEHNGIAGGEYVGAVAGYARSTEIEGVSMESEGTEEVSGRRYVGGLVGWNVDGTVVGYATGSVSGGSYVGGLVGVTDNSSTVTGYATGSVSGDDYVGGLVGYSDGTVVGYATGAVSGGSYVGGLVGYSRNGPVTGYATGAVLGNNDVGGLVGYNVSGGTITGYWDLETTSDGSYGIGISSTANIYYYTAATEPSGRVQNMYYDKGTGYLYSKDSGDRQIFNDGDFASIFELPKADGVWPKLKKSFTVGDRTITLPKAIYDAQEGIVNWPAE